MTDHAAEVRALCAAAKLSVLRLDEEAMTAIVRRMRIDVTVLPLRLAPATVIQKLYGVMKGGSIYTIMYNHHVEDGSESFTFTPARIGKGIGE